MCEWWSLSKVSPRWKHICDSRDSWKKSPHTLSAERKKLTSQLLVEMHITVLSCCCELHLVIQSWYISTGRWLIWDFWSSQRCPTFSPPSHIFSFFVIAHVCNVWPVSIPPQLCSLLVRNRPLSFLLSHPCSNRPHKQASQTKWLTTERGVCKRSSAFNCFFLFHSKCFLY